MQSNGNSFIGDVIVDSFNILYRDEDSILNQKYDKQILWALYSVNRKLINKKYDSNVYVQYFGLF